jgi:hypothetical protein
MPGVIGVKVTIHIGMPKTGTSAIQSFLGVNRDWIESQDIVIPGAGFNPALGHCFLFSRSDFKDPGAAAAQLVGEIGRLRELKDEISLLKGRDARHALLTWEGFSHFDRSAIETLYDALEGCELEILCYIREQSRLLTSQILQSVKSEIVTARDLMSDTDRLMARWQAHADYHQMLGNWHSAGSGNHRVRTRVFDRSLLAGGDIVDDFIAALGLERPADMELHGEDVNTSLDEASTAIVALFEEVGINHRHRYQLIHALLNADKTAKPKPETGLFTSEQLAGISEMYRESNLALLEDYPPENCTAEYFGELMLHPPASTTQVTGPTIELCRAAIAAIRGRAPKTWHGELLQSHRLGDITHSVGEGWRSSEDDGIWSVGDRSTIAFRLPHVPLGSGPASCLVQTNARYFGDNQSTVIKGMGVEERVDMREGEICIPLTEEALDNGISLDLIHDHPVSPVELGTGPSEDKLALKLRKLSYRLISSS